MWQFYFVDSAGGEDGQLAATILADCLTRQGRNASCTGGQVSVDGPSDGEKHLFLLLDESLVDHPVVRANLDAESGLVVCSARPARVLLDQLGGAPASVVTVDAAGIAFDQGTDPVTALLGGAARIAPWIDPELLCAAIWASYDRGFGYEARTAIRAFDQGYLQAQQASGAAQRPHHA